MIYNLCKAIGVRVTREIAECVYTALITDTGSFHYANTTERTFKVASELVRAGVKPAKLAQAVFGSYPWGKIRLTSLVLSTVERDPTGRVAWLRQTLDMQQAAGASEEDADGFVNYPLSCGEVEAVAFLKETQPGLYRVSLRSKGDVNVARIAERFGGGGHRNAAGCTLVGEWDEAESLIVSHLIDAVERQPASADAWMRLARFQIRTDDAPGAYRSAAIALRLDPLNLPAKVASVALELDARSATATGTPLPQNPAALGP
jgi:phosphoesterase RecJ-like protein